MISFNLHQFLNDYLETLTGLHTGQIGRANTHLVKLMDFLLGYLKRLPPEKITAIVPAMQSMATAKELDDSVTLADTLQFELPGLMLSDIVGNGLFDIAILARLRPLIPLLDKHNGIEIIASELQLLYQVFPNADGLASYFTEYLIAKNRQADAVRLFATEAAENRLSPWSAYTYSLSLARTLQDELAIETMDLAYDKSMALQNGFIELGLIKAAQLKPEQALSLAQKDETSHRLTPGSEFKLKLAQLYECVGKLQQASDLINAAYQENPELQNGYAMLGWQKGHRDRNWQDAYAIMAKDAHTRRITPLWKKNLAQAAAHAGLWNDANSLVEETYQCDDSQMNGFTRVGWCGYLLGEGNDFFNQHMAKDQSRKRFAGKADGGPVFQAIRYVLDGKPDDQVYAFLSEASQTLPGNQNWFCMIGWLYIRNGDFQTGYQLMQHDYNADLMHYTLWYPSFAVAMLLAGEQAEAKAFIQSGSSDDWLTDPVVIGYSTLPDAVLSIDAFERMIATPDQSPEYNMLVARFKETQH